MKNYPYPLRALFVSTLIIAAFPLSLHASTCIDLTQDLRNGSTNSSSHGAVSLLQTYLIEQGYLSSSSLGRFGNATESAVRKFQARYSISTSGSVGPITRAKIKSLTCTTNTNQSAATQTSTQTSTTGSNVTVIASPTPRPVATTQSTTLTDSKVGYVVTSPQTSRNLTLGDRTTIIWTGPQSRSVDIVLENSDGVTQGYITSGLSGSNQYTWTVGDIFVGSSPAHTLSGPGSYRIRVRDTATGRQINDRPSSLFTIDAIPLSIRYLIPSTVPADDTTTVVVYGNGFNSTSAIRIDGENGRTVSPVYKSPDGKLLTFTIPRDLDAGQHSIAVKNTYTTASTTPSGAQMITVTATNN